MKNIECVFIGGGSTQQRFTVFVDGEQVGQRNIDSPSQEDAKDWVQLFDGQILDWEEFEAIYSSPIAVADNFSSKEIWDGCQAVLNGKSVKITILTCQGWELVASFRFDRERQAERFFSNITVEDVKKYVFKN